MGMNYFWHEKPACKECKRDYPRRHIGKSSFGWCFALHVYPEALQDQGELSINELDDWIHLWSTSGSYIENENHERIPSQRMIEIICDRDPKSSRRQDPDRTHCLGPGKGMYDLCVGADDSGW